jgi:5-methyltetrahydropteroyltriglutamate--homocysteine methyltransferase
MKRSTDRILTTHVGSLVRPPEVIEINSKRAIGAPFTPEQLATLRGAINEAVRLQVECGIDIPSDGEFSKGSFSGYVSDRLTGYEIVPSERGLGGFSRSRDRTKFPEAYAEEGTSLSRQFGAPVCTGPIKYKGESFVEQDIANFREALKGLPIQEPFMPAVAPGTIELQRRNEYYKTAEEYVFAIAEAMKTEYKMIVDAGFVLQIDDPRLVTEWDSMDPAPTPEQYAKFAAVRIEALNHALAGLPEDRIRYHLCWGSWHGPHTTDAELKDIVDVFLKVKAQAFSVEAANPRHMHEYHVWEGGKLPEGKILIPGVIAHTTNCVEHPELVAERLVTYANIVGRENVIAGADCGFAQTATIHRVHPTIVWEKFRVLAEGARLATKRLFGRAA